MHLRLGLLNSHRDQISMAAVGKAEENGFAERFMRTIKEEEADLSEYRNFAEAQAQIGHFIEDVFTQNRRHSLRTAKKVSSFMVWVHHNCFTAFEMTWGGDGRLVKFL